MASACHPTAIRQAPAQERGPTAATLPASNVARDDYAGSAVCAGCHPDVAATWSRSPMHRMTRDIHGAVVRAAFGGTRFAFGADVAVLEQHDGERFVRIEQGDGGKRSYRVTRVLGGRTREDFVGVEDGTHDEVVLPVSYVFATGALRYKGYSVMLHERSSLRAGPVWSRTCIFCHNTVPELDRMLGAFAGPHAGAYQGEQVEPWLPVDRRMSVEVVDAEGFRRETAAEVSRLGVVSFAGGSSPKEVAKSAIEVVRSDFEGSRMVEEGIGCEACHGGSRRHARDPRVAPSLVPEAPWLRVSLPAPPRADARAEATNRVCARCHQVLFTRYPFTWEGGRRDGAAGGSHISSGEGRDFLLGACTSRLSCTACHDPHGGDDPGRMRALATPAGNGVCTACHTELAAAEPLRAHAHHDPAGAGGSCVACHMPRKNMGLDGSLTRYHRIGSPTDPERVLGDRPLECALCHAKKSVGSLVDTMEAWWPVRYPRQRLEELYGSLGANPIVATLERGKAHEQAVALGILREAPDPAAAPLVAKQLSNEYPLVRAWARAAMDASGLKPSPVAPPSPSAPGPEREEPPED
jgi:predicted CXXCH cytochrome family protein